MNRQANYAEELAKLIRMETESSPDGNNDLAKFSRFHDLMWELFPHIREACELKEFDGSLLLKWKGSGSGKLPVLYMNHHDVVPANPEGWKYPPYSGTIADGKIWGRGTLDDKGGLWAMLRAADELAAEGFVPDRDIYFESACTEETTGKGADAISAWLQNEGIRFEMVFDEGGDIVRDPIGGSDALFAMIGVGEKSIVNMRFVARSDGGHASTPGKNTPLVRLGKFMAYVDRHPVFKTELSPVVAEMLRRISPYTKAIGKVIGRPDRTKKLLEIVLPKIGGAAGSLLSTTIAFTMAGGGEAENTIPREAWVIGNMRCSHHQGSRGSIEAITKAAAKFDVSAEIINADIESGLTDYRERAFSLVEEAVKATIPGVNACAPYVMTGASDARFFSRVSDQCIRFLPFTITDEQMDSIHGVNECLDLDTLAPAVDYFRYMFQHM